MNEKPIYEVKDGLITIKGKQYPIKLQDGFYNIRKLTVKECMRLQTVPEWFEFPVSDTRAYQQLGNGWTCSVIEWLIKCCLKEELEHEQLSLF
jgi:DNA (cytosine-5)-methyltransferase 3A